MVNLMIVVKILLFILYLAHPFNLIQVSFLSFISFIVSSNLKQQISSNLDEDEDEDEGEDEDEVVLII